MMQLHPCWWLAYVLQEAIWTPLEGRVFFVMVRYVLSRVLLEVTFVQRRQFTITSQTVDSRDLWLTADGHWPTMSTPPPLAVLPAVGRTWSAVATVLRGRPTHDERKPLERRLSPTTANSHVVVEGQEAPTKGQWNCLVTTHTCDHRIRLVKPQWWNDLANLWSWVVEG